MIYKKTFDAIPAISAALLHEDVAILPTDTIYGLSGIVSPAVHKKIVSLKGREQDKPFIELISCPTDIYQITDFVPQKLVELWPAPLTLIVKDKRQGADCPTVAIRCPDDDWLRALIKKTGAIYSTSVNHSGEKPLILPKDIVPKWESLVALVVDGGTPAQTSPSTIVKITSEGAKIIRQGVLKVPL